MSVKALFMFALNPLGGSLVTLTEFCNTETGKDFEGIELMYNLNSLWILFGSSAILKTIRSIDNIQEVARWQF